MPTTIETTRFSLSHCVRGGMLRIALHRGGAYLARLTGTDPVFGFRRAFVADGARPGRDYREYDVSELVEGAVYEAQSSHPSHERVRLYLLVKDGALVPLAGGAAEARRRLAGHAARAAAEVPHATL